MRPAAWAQWLRPAGGPGLLVLALVVGTGAGLGAAILIKSLELVGKATAQVADRTDYWMLLTIPLGMVIAWAVTSRFAPEVAGHGVPQIIAAITVRGGYIRPRVPALKTVATALTIGTGGSAGREGSIAQIGAGLGSIVGQITNLSEPAMRALVAAGAGAGIAATFNAPIAGMFFAMEVVLRDLSVRHLHLVVAASVAGAVVSHSLIGDELTFRVSPFALEDPWQLLPYALLGLVSVVLALLFIEALDLLHDQPVRVTRWLRPLGFGMAVGAIGFAMPEVLGTGQPFIENVLRQEVEKTWWVFALLALAKLLATSLTLGGRGAGGIFMPSLFIGAVAGTAFAELSTTFWHRSPIESGAFALVGMAAVFAGVARAPLTSILIVFEITGDYGLVLPLMLAVAISTVLATRFHPLSAYTSPLQRMGIHTPRMDHVDLLDTVTVGDLGLRAPEAVSVGTTLTEVEGLLYRQRLHGAPVLDGDRLVGVVTQADILRSGGPSDQVTAGEAMTPNPVVVTPDITVAETLERMAAMGVGRLPVVASDDPRRLISVFRREDAIAAYHLALGSAARRQRLPDRVAARTSDDTRFFEFEIPSGSVAAGRRIMEIPWPEGCIVVSVDRGSELLVASGELVLREGDALTVFGDALAHRRLVNRLGARGSPGSDR